ncbi:MAG: transglycosylase domain-containing protein [Candidatus Latescibacteria bacterium]|nr:transglycosylase domain-containing protein [Candidatus Latescibacterota bacterium]
MRFLRFLLRTAALGALTACAAGFLGYLYFNHQLPEQLTAIEHYNPEVTSHVYAANGELIGEFYLHRRIVVPIEQIPDIVLQAFVAAEDQNFFRHTGVDYVGIFRALVKNLAAGRIVQGGSTITQQIARDFFLNRERSFSRKIKEAILAYRIENELSKEEILYLYLNQVYLGHGAYGVQAASQSYFGKDVRQVNLAEATMLAGLPQAPSRYSPYSNFTLAKQRQIYVLDRMLEDGYITPLEGEYARKYPVRIVPSVDLNSQVAPYFVEHIRRYIMTKYGSDRVYTSGLKIQTTLDVWIQRAANEAVEEGLKELDKRQGFRGPEEHLIGSQVEEYLRHQDLELTILKSGKVPKKGQSSPRLTIGHAYRMSLGQEKNDYDRRMAGSAVRFTADDAEKFLSEFRGKGWNNQAVGTVLVEYMRTKWNGAGIPDIQSRLARMIETMAGGDGFEAAFQKEFGTTFAALRKSFMKHLNDTKDDPQARLQGTIWQSTSPPDSSERPDD